MKGKKKMFRIFALVAVFGMILTACDDGSGDNSVIEDSEFSGNIVITPAAKVDVGTELTASYETTVSLSYQWNKDGAAIDGATGSKYAPLSAGSYTVTISATGYNPKTSDPVTVVGFLISTGKVSGPTPPPEELAIDPMYRFVDGWTTNSIMNNAGEGPTRQGYWTVGTGNLDGYAVFKNGNMDLEILYYSWRDAKWNGTGLIDNQALKLPAGYNNGFIAFDIYLTNHAGLNTANTEASFMAYSNMDNDNNYIKTNLRNYEPEDANHINKSNEWITIKRRIDGVGSGYGSTGINALARFGFRLVDFDTGKGDIEVSFRNLRFLPAD